MRWMTHKKNSKGVARQDKTAKGHFALGKPNGAIESYEL